MLDEETFEKALSLMKAFGRAIEKEDQLQIMAQLLTIEKAMSHLEQCEYAMALCAKVHNTSVEEIEEQYGISAVSLEFENDETLNMFINTHRGNLLNRFTEQASIEMTMRTLQNLKDMGVDLISSGVAQTPMTLAILRHAQPIPNQRMN